MLIELIGAKATAGVALIVLGLVFVVGVFTFGYTVKALKRLGVKWNELTEKQKQAYILLPVLFSIGLIAYDLIPLLIMAAIVAVVLYKSH